MVIIKYEVEEREMFEKHILSLMNSLIEPLSKMEILQCYYRYCREIDKQKVEMILKEKSLAYKIIDLKSGICRIVYLLNIYNTRRYSVEDLLQPFLIDSDINSSNDIDNFSMQTDLKESYKLLIDSDINLSNDIKNLSLQTNLKKSLKLLGFSKLRVSYFIIDKSNLDLVKSLLLNRLNLKFEYFLIKEKNNEYDINDLVYYKVEDYYPVEDEYTAYKILCDLRQANIPFCLISDRSGKFSIRCEVDIDDKYKYYYRADLNCALRSSWEANIARVFNYLNLSWKYEKNSFKRLDCQGNHTGNYFPDFFLDDNIIVEVKGFWNQESLSKAKEFVSNYKEYKYYFIDHDIYYNLKQIYMPKIAEWESDSCDCITTESVKVVGITYGERKKTLLSIKKGDKILLKRDSLNKFDENAILALTTDNKEIGFLTSEWALVYAKKMDIGLKFDAVIKKIEQKVVTISVKQSEDTTNLTYDFLINKN